KVSNVGPGPPTAKFAGTTVSTAMRMDTPRPVRDSTVDRRVGRGSSSSGAGVRVYPGSLVTVQSSLMPAHAHSERAIEWTRSSVTFVMRRTPQAIGGPVTDEDSPWMRLLRELFGDD